MPRTPTPPHPTPSPHTHGKQLSFGINPLKKKLSAHDVLFYKQIYMYMFAEFDKAINLFFDQMYAKIDNF